MVGSLLGWKSLLTNLRTSEDYVDIRDHNTSILLPACWPTFPTAASPSSTSFTLLLGFGADTSLESVIEGGEGALLARKLRPTPYADSLQMDQERG